MKLRYSLRVDGQDYTDRLISVSAIDTGVKGLGFGYISDITVDCAFERSLLDSVGSSVEVGVHLDTTTTTYKGTVQKVSVQGGKLSLSVNASNPEALFKPRQRIYIGNYNRYVSIPVVYGNGWCKANLLAIQKKNDGIYQLLVGDNPNVAGAYQYSSGVYVLDNRILRSQDKEKWATLPDGSTNQAWDISQYSSDQYLEIMRYCHQKYGVRQQQNGTLDKTLLGSSDSVFVEGGLYQWIEFVDISGCLIDSWSPVQVYEWSDPIEGREITDIQYINVSSLASPYQIIENILGRNGISYTTGAGFLGISLCFQADEPFKDIVQKVAEQGLIYVVPHHDSFRIVPAVFTSVPTRFFFTDAMFLQQSVSVEKSPALFNTLKVLYDREDDTLTVGSGTPEKEYRADFITDTTSAQTFANAYLQYHQKNTKVRFSTPLSPEFIAVVDVGDVVTVSYPLYGLNQNFQVVQKSIRKERVDWVVKEI